MPMLKNLLLASLALLIGCATTQRRGGTEETPHTIGEVLGDAQLDQRNTTLDSEVPGGRWQAATQCGQGVDALTGGSRSSAVKCSKEWTPSPSVSRHHWIKTMESSEDFGRLIKAHLSGAYNTSGIQLKGSTDFLNEVSYSNRTMSIVTRYSLEGDTLRRPRQVTMPEEYKEEAKKDPARFRERHGDYYVSGQIDGADITVVAVFQASTASDLTRFAASLEAAKPDLFDAKASAEFRRELKKSNISVSVESWVRGAPADGTMDPPTSLEEIPAYITWFGGHHEMVPLRAHLTHYSTLTHAIGNTLPIPPSYWADISEIRDIYQAAQATLDTMPPEFSRFQPDVSRLGNVFRGSAASALTDQSVVSDIMPLAAEVRARTLDLHRREAFWNEVIAGQADVPNKNQKQKAGGHTSWLYGATQYPHPEDMTLRVATFDTGSKDKKVGRLEQTFSFNKVTDVIVGFEVISVWGPDGHNGAWVMRSDKDSGGLGSSSLSVEVMSVWNRGYHWKMNVYFASREDLPFGGTATDQDESNTQPEINWRDARPVRIGDLDDYMKEGPGCSEEFYVVFPNGLLPVNGTHILCADKNGSSPTGLHTLSSLRAKHGPDVDLLLGWTANDKVVRQPRETDAATLVSACWKPTDGKKTHLSSLFPVDVTPQALLADVSQNVSDELLQPRQTRVTFRTELDRKDLRVVAEVYKPEGFPSFVINTAYPDNVDPAFDRHRTECKDQ